ncbi:TPA: MFS transporter [Klebsiella oxytoca]|uniref:MFS transporter n=1 Tax=Klebsiella oxytoca TaxID=571 RepID=A0AAN5LC55_KLEOX|nr:MFS transporter [Klebsiella oxytoca]
MSSSTKLTCDLHSHSTRKPTNVRWRIFFVLFLLVVVSMVDRASISIAMPTIAKELGLSGTMQGLILSGFFWTYACMQIPGGFLADKFGARVILTVSAVLWGIAEALLGLCPTGFALLGANLLLGASEAPVFPSGARLNAIWLNRNERARGATLMDAGGPFGAAIGGILVAEMIMYFSSWRITFIICGAAAILLGLIAYWIIRDTPEASPKVNNCELEIINHGRAENEVIAVDDNRPLLKVMPLRSLVGMLLGRCSWAMCFFGLLTWGPGYLTRALHLDLKAVGFATMIIFCAGGCGSLCGGWLADKLSSRGTGRAKSCKLLLTLSGICTLVSFAILPSIPDVKTSVILLSCAAFVLMWGSMYWSFPPLLAPRSRVGTVGGMMNMAGSIGGICIPLLVGFILDLTNSFNPVLYFFAGCAVVFILMTNIIDLSHVR